MRQRQRHYLLKPLVAMIAGLTLAAPALAQTGRVAGTVRDDKGQPIKGATVAAENAQALTSSFTTTTDDKGRYALIGLAKGQWTFRASAPGFAGAEERRSIATLSSNPPIDFKLARGAAPPPGLGGTDAKALQAELLAADQLMAQKQYDQAIDAYRAILAKSPALSLINIQVGNAYRLKKDYDQAMVAYQEALKANPGNETAIVQIGMTNLEKGDLKAADATLTQAAQTSAASREVFYALGEVKFAEGQIDEAGGWYEKAVKADPAWGKPVLKLALIAVNKGDRDGAIGQLEKLIALDPNSTEAGQAKAMIEQLRK